MLEMENQIKVQGIYLNFREGIDGLPDGSAALLKSRRHVAKSDAVETWKKLRAEGWNRVEPQWGLGLDP